MRVVVVAGGAPVAADLGQLAGADLVIAADGGARWLHENGLRPDLLVGDMDSITPALLAELAAAGVAVERHPADKDASDAELALERAVAAGATSVVVIGALGGPRLDHELANLFLVTDAGWSDALADLRIVRGSTVVRALRDGGELAIDGEVGTLVTLLPVAGDVAGVWSDGLRYPLAGDVLRMGRSRGLSNVVARAPASVRVERGVLLVMELQPEGADR